MRPFVFASLIIFTTSFGLYAAENAQELQEQIIDLSDGALKVGTAIEILNRAEICKITNKEMLWCMVPFIGGSAIFETLGGIGYHFTCIDDGGYEAAKFICGTCIASLSLGSLMLAAGILTPVAVLAINYTREHKNMPKSEFLKELHKMDRDADLPKEFCGRLLLFIDENQKSEILEILSSDQESLLAQDMSGG